jgi:hypothetical protein
MTAMLVLLNEEGGVVDARYLRCDVVIHLGDEVHFACHDDVVGVRLDRIDHVVASMPLEMIDLRSSRSQDDMHIGGQVNLWLLWSSGQVRSDRPVDLGEMRLRKKE